MLAENLDFISLALPTALADIKSFKQQHRTQPKLHNWGDEELIRKLENCLDGLDRDIVPHIECFIMDFKNHNNIAPMARYIIESLDNTYSSCGINQEVLKTLIPFSDFSTKKGIDFGFGNAEILSLLGAMGVEIIGLEKNPLFVQKVRDNGYNAHVSDVDCDHETFKKLELCNSYDFAISTLILDRVGNPYNFLINLLSVLKPGGRFALQTLLPVTGVSDGDVEEPIIYTPIERRITPGVSHEEDRYHLLKHLQDLGAKDLQVYLIPYIVASRDGMRQYDVWSFCGSR